MSIMSVNISRAPAQEQESVRDRLMFAVKAALAGGVAVSAFLNAPEIIDQVVDYAQEAVTPDFSNAHPEAPIRNLPE